MKVVVVGTRGFPSVQGGVETHCEELYPRLVELGCDVTVVTRTPYIPKDQRKKSYKGVTLKHIYAPRKKSLEAIIHTFLAILYARSVSADIVHIHAIGPALMTPLARLLGLRTVVTHHGPDYDRQKWGKAARKVLLSGEAAGARFGNRVIVISNVIAGLLRDKYQRTDTILIYNGVTPTTPSSETDYLQSLGLSPKSYLIAVGRFVEEKGFHDLLDAYTQLDNPEMKLVLVGDADHESEYSRSLKARAAQIPGVVLTGFIKGEKLRQIFSHARLFVMPSYHEGLPIALLEAMNYGIPPLVSDIPANIEVNLAQTCYFKTGDKESLLKGIKRRLAEPGAEDFSIFLKKYSWDTNAEKTRCIYTQLSDERL